MQTIVVRQHCHFKSPTCVLQGSILRNAHSSIPISDPDPVYELMSDLILNLDLDTSRLHLGSDLFASGLVHVGFNIHRPCFALFLGFRTLDPKT